MEVLQKRTRYHWQGGQVMEEPISMEVKTRAGSKLEASSWRTPQAWGAVGWKQRLISNFPTSSSVVDILRRSSEMLWSMRSLSTSLNSLTEPSSMNWDLVRQICRASAKRPPAKTLPKERHQLRSHLKVVHNLEGLWVARVHLKTGSQERYSQGLQGPLVVIGIKVL
jgi:hypothetical protein